MATPAWRSRTAYGAYDADDDFGELSPSERLGPPLARTGSRALLRGSIIILFAVGIGWPLLGERATQPEWWLSKIATVSAAIDAKLQEPLEQPARASSALPSTVVTTSPMSLDARVPASPPPASSREAPAAPARPEALWPRRLCRLRPQVRKSRRQSPCRRQPSIRPTPIRCVPRPWAFIPICRASCWRDFQRPTIAMPASPSIPRSPRRLTTRSSSGPANASRSSRSSRSASWPAPPQVAGATWSA